jgi:GTP-binding protein HflX
LKREPVDELREDLLVTPERAFLVGAAIKGGHPLLGIEDSLDELALLAETAGMEVCGRASQQVGRIHPATWIGSGKVDEVSELLEECDAQVVVFDDELSPRHQRELEKRFGEDIKLLDRSALILDIFAQHASSREGALQVELAQYEYRLPRLTRQWTHLARQAGGGVARGGSGGVGLRGPGETQLEVDRREIGRKIRKLKQDLEQVRAHRGRYRSRRTRSNTPVVALVGYTNAGKSTLFRALTNSQVYVADQLFATLDPTTRKMPLPSGREVLVTDTVGFIQKLPATLVAAFQATLEEVLEADIALHIVDAAHPNARQHIEAVEDTLATIDMPVVPNILVWNKLDLVDAAPPLPEILNVAYAGVAAVSALRGSGLEELSELIEHTLGQRELSVRLRLPWERGDLISGLYDASTVEEIEHTADGVLVTASLSAELYDRYSEYRV